MVQTQFNTYIKIVRSDNGGEYLFSGLCTYFNEPEIIHQTTCANTPQQNRVPEWKKSASFGGNLSRITVYACSQILLG
jgi:hypothetical protein